MNLKYKENDIVLFLNNKIIKYRILKIDLDMEVYFISAQPSEKRGRAVFISELEEATNLYKGLDTLNSNFLSKKTVKLGKTVG